MGARPIDNELPIPVGSFTDKQFAVSDEDVEDDPTPHGSLASRYEELRKNLPAKTKWINSTIFKKTLRGDLDRDNQIITGMLDRFGSWDSTRDHRGPSPSARSNGTPAARTTRSAPPSPPRRS